MRKAQRTLAAAAEAWDAAENAYAQERARYVATVWGDPPDWKRPPVLLEPEVLARLDALGVEAAAAATEYEIALEEYAKQA